MAGGSVNGYLQKQWSFVNLPDMRENILMRTRNGFQGTAKVIESPLDQHSGMVSSHGGVGRGHNLLSYQCG